MKYADRAGQAPMNIPKAKTKSNIICSVHGHYWIPGGTRRIYYPEMAEYLAKQAVHSGYLYPFRVDARANATIFKEAASQFIG